MPLSSLSWQRMKTCHPDLQRVVTLASSRFPFEVLCGHRNQADQEAAVAGGRSKEHWPHSRHNSDPSEAVDLAPLPIDWTAIDRFRLLAKVVKDAAADLNVAISWGGDWVTIHDFPHFELTRRQPATPEDVT